MPLEFISYLPQVKAEMQEIITEKTEQATEFLADRIREKISLTEGSGRIYSGHRASAPGEPPTRVTGELQDSITTAVEVTMSGVSGVVETEDPKAVYHEFGTSKEAPRPFFESTYEENKETIINMLGGD